MQRAISPTLFYGVVAAALALSMLVVGFASLKAEAATDFSVPTQQPGRLTYYTFFNSTTTNATSTNTTDGSGQYVIAGAKNVNLFFSRGGATNPNTGATQFRIQVSPDGSSWFDYNALILNGVTPGNAAPAYVGTSTISAATSTVITRMAQLGFYSIRCIALETTDGEHTCRAEAEF